MKEDAFTAAVNGTLAGVAPPAGLLTYLLQLRKATRLLLDNPDGAHNELIDIMQQLAGSLRSPPSGPTTTTTGTIPNIATIMAGFAPSVLATSPLLVTGIPGFFNAIVASGAADAGLILSRFAVLAAAWSVNINQRVAGGRTFIFAPE